MGHRSINREVQCISHPARRMCRGGTSPRRRGKNCTERNSSEPLLYFLHCGPNPQLCNLTVFIRREMKSFSEISWYTNIAWNPQHNVCIIGNKRKYNTFFFTKQKLKSSIPQCWGSDANWQLSEVPCCASESRLMLRYNIKWVQMLRMRATKQYHFKYQKILLYFTLLSRSTSDQVI